jgi:hypothetical protein
VTGAQAAGRLRAYSGVFVVLCPVVAALAGDWRAPDRSLLALAVVAAIVLGALIRGVGPDLGVRLAGFLALAGAALFVGRYLDVREWARATQLTLGGALSAFVAAGLLAAARYELRKAERTGTT